MGEVEWEMARILQGRPAVGKELTEQHIPLEAGLYHAVSLNKGCYMGQETLAKVHKLNAVKQQLQGLLLDAAVQPGTPLLSGDSSCLCHTPPSNSNTFFPHHVLPLSMEARPLSLAGTGLNAAQIVLQDCCCSTLCSPHAPVQAEALYMMHVMGQPTPYLVCHLAFDSQAFESSLLPNAGFACNEHIRLLAQVVKRQEL